MTNIAVQPRKRDSTATRAALLDAARELFGARGYDDTTLREIGDRAGVDASLIARYFGNKAALYIAVLGSEGTQYHGTTINEIVADAVARLLEKSDSRGVGPITQALFNGDIDPEIRAAAAERFQRRLIARLSEKMTSLPESQHQLLAETAISALIGVTFMRAAGGFDELTQAPRKDVQEIVERMLMSIVGDP